MLCYIKIHLFESLVTFFFHTMYIVHDNFPKIMLNTTFAIQVKTPYGIDFSFCTFSCYNFNFRLLI